MKDSWHLVLIASTFLWPVQSLPASQRPPLSQGTVGHVEAGAEKLAGYLIQDTPTIPIKKFAQDAGFRSNVSPSRRGVAILIGSKISTVYDLKKATVDGKDFELSVAGVERDGDFFIPLEFYERLLPNTVRYDRKRRVVTFALPNRTLNVPIKPLPAGVRQ